MTFRQKRVSMGSATEHIQTTLDPPEAEQVFEYKDEHDLSKAAAVRRLTMKGLELEKGEVETDRNQADQIVWAVTAAALVAIPMSITLGGTVLGLLAWGYAIAALAGNAYLWSS